MRRAHSEVEPRSLSRRRSGPSWRGAASYQFSHTIGRVSFPPGEVVHVWPPTAHWRFVSVGATFAVHVVSQPCS